MTIQVAVSAYNPHDTDAQGRIVFGNSGVSSAWATILNLTSQGILKSVNSQGANVRDVHFRITLDGGTIQTSGMLLLGQSGASVGGGWSCDLYFGTSCLVEAMSTTVAPCPVTVVYVDQ